jgi:hypothetical protein
MTALVLVLLVVAVVVASGWGFRRRAIEREHRRVDALNALAGQLEGVAGSLRASRAPAPEPLSRAPAPLPRVAPGGRAALLDATSEAVSRARAEETRLAVAVVEAAKRGADELGGDVASAVGLTAYTVGPQSVAVVLPGAGRAEALGALARIQAACGANGHAVELEPDEEAVELLARLLSPVPYEPGAWPQPHP